MAMPGCQLGSLRLDIPRLTLKWHQTMQAWIRSDDDIVRELDVLTASHRDELTFGNPTLA